MRGPQLFIQFHGRLRVLPEIGLGVLPALADALAPVAKPGAALLDEALIGGQVQEVPFPGDPLAEDDVEFRLLEGRRQLVFHHLHPAVGADGLIPLLDGADAADVQAHARIKLQGVAPGGGFGVPEHHPDLMADLVDEDHRGQGFADGRGELAQGLGHQAGLGTHLGVAHVPFDFRAGHQGGHRVHHHHVHRVGAHQDLGDLQGLFTGIGLGDEQVLGPDPQLAGIDHVQGVLGVYEGRHPALELGLGDDVQGQGGLAGGLRPEDLDDPAPGDAADPQGQVQGEAAAGDHRHVRLLIGPQAHDGALAILFFDVTQGLIQGLGLIRRNLVAHSLYSFCWYFM